MKWVTSCKGGRWFHSSEGQRTSHKWSKSPRPGGAQTDTECPWQNGVRRLTGQSCITWVSSPKYQMNPNQTERQATKWLACKSSKPSRSLKLRKDWRTAPGWRRPGMMRKQRQPHGPGWGAFTTKTVLVRLEWTSLGERNTGALRGILETFSSLKLFPNKS